MPPASDDVKNQQHGTAEGASNDKGTYKNDYRYEYVQKADRMKRTVCLYCGLVVGDTAVHDAWHRGLIEVQHMAEDAASGTVLLG